MQKKMDVPHLAFLACTIVMAGLTVAIVLYLLNAAAPVLGREGLSFLTGTMWDADTHTYGIGMFVLGTTILTAMTMAIAIPVGFLTTVFLTEWAPAWLEKLIRPAIELLVGIPSIVYGIFGFFILEGIFKDTINPGISSVLGWIPIFNFHDRSTGQGFLLAAVVLAIMVLPTIVSLTQESFTSVPREFREASLSVGATRWETVKKVVVPVAFPGIVTAFILATMRAMGETMAVVMLIGNATRFPTSIFDQATPMTAKILNDVGHYIIEPEPLSALFGIAVVLFAIEIIVVGATRLIIMDRINGQ